MKEDSNVKKIVIETSRITEGSCGGALERKKKNSRKLKSKADGRFVYIKNDLLKPLNAKKPFDPTAWYVAETKRNKEKISVELLQKLDLGYSVEAYAAVQASTGGKVVIHGKIFIRVDESHRQALLPLCPYLKRYVTDSSRYVPDHNMVEFARVPDKQMNDLQTILKEADGDIEYSESLQGCAVRFKRGILSKSENLKNLTGEIEMINGRKRATVILDKIGVFKFNLPISDLGKILR